MLSKKHGADDDDDDDDDDRDLKIQQRDGNENVYKTIGLISRKTTLHVHHAFLYIALPFLHDHDVKMLNLVFYAERKQTTTKVYFAF